MRQFHYGSACPGSHYVDEVDFKLTEDPSISISQVLGLRSCTTMQLYFKISIPGKANTANVTVVTGQTCWCLAAWGALWPLLRPTVKSSSHTVQHQNFLHTGPHCYSSFKTLLENLSLVCRSETSQKTSGTAILKHLAAVVGQHFSTQGFILFRGLEP